MAYSFDRARENAWKTAMVRLGPSAPLRALLARGLATGHVLDYGCGRGADQRHLELGTPGVLTVGGWDPHFFPARWFSTGQFDTVLCTYVLNVIPRSEERKVLEDLRGLLREGGRAFIAVRRDVRHPGIGANGAYQRPVKLALPIEVEEKNRFAIYRLEKNGGST